MWRTVSPDDLDSRDFRSLFRILLPFSYRGFALDINLIPYGPIITGETCLAGKEGRLLSFLPRLLLLRSPFSEFSLTWY